MASKKKHPVVAIIHPDETVFCWGHNAGVATVRSCLTEHPKEKITVEVVQMTEAEFDALEEYKGDC